MCLAVARPTVPLLRSGKSRPPLRSSDQGVLEGRKRDGRARNSPLAKVREWKTSMHASLAAISAGWKLCTFFINLCVVPSKIMHNPALDDSSRGGDLLAVVRQENDLTKYQSPSQIQLNLQSPLN